MGMGTGRDVSETSTVPSWLGELCRQEQQRERLEHITRKFTGVEHDFVLLKSSEVRYECELGPELSKKIQPILVEELERITRRVEAARRAFLEDESVGTHDEA
jgi:hypothetical protein